MTQEHNMADGTLACGPDQQLPEGYMWMRGVAARGVLCALCLSAYAGRVVAAVRALFARLLTVMF